MQRPRVISRRTFRPLLVAGLVAGTAWAASDPFVGQWKLNASRSKLTDEMKVTKVRENEYTFDFGGGNPETVVVDGTDQPGFGGSTLSVAAEGPNWKVVRKKSGRMLLAATWTLSKDGRSLTDDFTSFGQNGSPSNVRYVYTRAAGGGSGFAGDWVSTSEVVNSVIRLEVRPHGRHGLSFTGVGGTTNVRFDGKSARRSGARTMEMIQRDGGRIMLLKQYELSRDLQTLTVTVRTVGHAAPDVFVFERQKEPNRVP